MKNKTLKIFLVMAMAPFVLTSCGKQETQAPPPVRRARPVQQPAVQAEVMDKTAGIDSSTEVKHRNPFQSYIVLAKGAPGARKVKGPLECCDLGQFKLVAVVVGSENSFALVQAPDGKRYVVRRGDLIGDRDGRIVRFDARSVTVREISRDEDGKEISSTDTDIRLPSEKGA